MLIDEIRDLLTSGELRVGVALGSVALLLVLVVALIRGDAGRARPLPLAGLLIAGAGALAIASSSTLPWRVVIGLAVLTVAGAISQLAFRIPLALGGAIVVASALPDEPRWIPVAVVGTVTVGGLATAGFDRRAAATGLGPVLFAISSVGLYVTVPETDTAVAFVAATVPLAFTGWPRALARLGDAGSLTAVALLCWVASTGGTTRPSSVVGALACLGVLVVEPASRMLLRARAADRLPPRLLLVALHVVVVLLVARIAGLRSSTLAAVVIVSVVLAAAFVVMSWLIRSAEPSR